MHTPTSPKSAAHVRHQKRQRSIEELKKDEDMSHSTTTTSGGERRLLSSSSLTFLPASSSMSTQLSSKTSESATTRRRHDDVLLLKRDTLWTEVSADRPFRIFERCGYALVDTGPREAVLRGLRHTEPPWKTCKDPEDNEEHPMYMLWTYRTDISAIAAATADELIDEYLQKKQQQGEQQQQQDVAHADHTPSEI